MDQRESENSDFSSLNDEVLSESGKNFPENFVSSQIVKIGEETDSTIESPTPEKPETRKRGCLVSSLARNLMGENLKGDSTSSDFKPCSCSEVKSVELSDDCKILEMLFNRMETSIRLLRLRHKMSTFKNISAQVEALIKRKFTHSHLAQMKYLLPDAINIKKILLHDEKSLCMYPELQVTLLMDTVECSQPHKSPSLALCHAFHSRLERFLTDNPTNTGIPEASIPPPFNSSEEMQHFPEASLRSTAEVLDDLEVHGFSRLSHFPANFQPSVSRRAAILSDENHNNCVEPVLPNHLITNSGAQEEPSKKIEIDFSENLCCSGSTPKKLCHEQQVVMAETPAQLTPRRSSATPLLKSESETSAAEEEKASSSARRSLLYHTTSGFQEDTSDLVSDSKGYEKIGASDGLRSNDAAGKRCLFPKEATSLVAMECENVDEQQEKFASIPITFDTICTLSRQKNGHLITKEELVHRILTSNMEIMDPSEAEEQLSILEELSPDLISRKVASSGDILYRL